MPEALICPKCAAEVQYRDAGPSLTCPRCHAPLQPEHASSASGTKEMDPELRELLAEVHKTPGGGGPPVSKIQAIKDYRQATGAGLAEAKRAVESAGPFQVGSPRPAASGGGLRWVAVLAIVGLIAGVVGAIFALVQRNGPTINPPTNIAPTAVVPNLSIPQSLLPSATPQFATMTMEFGSQGVGPGHFDDARSIAVDNRGHIYVGEYSNGRVQVFDTTGKYLSEFSLGPNSYLQNLIADRNGTVYAVSSSHILRFTGTTGAAVPEMDSDAGTAAPKEYNDACIGAMMYAISSSGGGEAEIVRLDTNSGKILGSFNTKKLVGESLDLFRIVSLATGEIYALDREKGVFKFAMDGRYINRFGGGKTAGVSPLDLPPSQLFSPLNIAADGQGRIYVSDAGSCIKVYDKDGNYIDKFGGHEVAFGIAIDDDDNIYACMRNRHTVRKFVISKR